MRAAGQHFPASGTIELELCHNARLRFRLTANDLPFNLLQEHPLAELVLPDIKAKLKVRLTRFKPTWTSGATTNPCVLCGVCLDSAEIDTGKPMDVVRFQLPNFPNTWTERVWSRDGKGGGFSRPIIDLSNCVWILDIRPSLKAEEGHEDGAQSASITLTHDAELRRRDGAPFGGHKAKRMLKALHYFFSFATGIWCTPVLPIGYDAAGNRVWEKWQPSRVDSWKNVRHWPDDHHGEQLAVALTLFLRKWVDRRWRRSLQSAIYWYVNSNGNLNTAGIDGCLVLSLIGLELMAWTTSRTSEGAIDPRKYDGWKARKKLRHLLLHSGIPIEIPPELKELHQAACSPRTHWQHGPHALTELRHALVHSSPENKRLIETTEHGVLAEATTLALWYFELALLHTIGYEGTYSNRLRSVSVGEVELVPWASSA